MPVGIPAEGGEEEVPLIPVFIHGWVHDIETGEVIDLNISQGPPGFENFVPTPEAGQGEQPAEGGDRPVEGEPAPIGEAPAPSGETAPPTGETAPPTGETAPPSSEAPPSNEAPPSGEPAPAESAPAAGSTEGSPTPTQGGETRNDTKVVGVHFRPASGAAGAAPAPESGATPVRARRQNSRRSRQYQARDHDKTHDRRDHDEGHQMLPRQYPPPVKMLRRSRRSSA